MRILAVIIAISLIAFFGLSYYAGIFDKMDMSLSEAGPYNLVYREHKGPYRGVRAALNAVSGFLSERKIPVPGKAFAVYYDNPRKKKAEDLRSIGGYITDTLMTGVATPFASNVFPKTLAVVADFPLRSFLSPMTGPAKFYSKLADILVKRRYEMAGPVMEIYDLAARKIVYIAPVK